MQQEAIITAVFEMDPRVRYVAVAEGQQIKMQQRPQLAGASDSESDRFEELLVNPTLIVLARQRGDIDCGGFRHIVVRYGHFSQVVVPLPRGGHVSAALEPDADPRPLAEAIETWLSLRSEWPSDRNE